MIKQIDILGIQIDNYTVRESMLRLESYLNTTVLSVIETVTMRQLAMVVENPTIKKCLNECELSVIGEKEILAETGYASVQRMREVKDKDFMQEFIKRIVRNQKRVYLIGLTQEDIQKAEEYLKKINPKFTSVDSYALDECEGDRDDIVNEINGEAPDIVISVLPSPYEEEFVLEHKDKISASVWYGLGMGYTNTGDLFNVGGLVKSVTQRGRLRHIMGKYEKENKDRK